MTLKIASFGMLAEKLCSKKPFSENKQLRKRWYVAGKNLVLTTASTVT